MHQKPTQAPAQLERRSFVEQSLSLLLAATAATAAPASAENKAPATAGSTLHFFPGFEAFQIDTGETIINGVKGGKGPPLLLLHGWPQTHVEWHKLAPRLAKDFTVVITDLRGYGDSGKPADGDNHAGYSKRAMARDQVEVMRKLGFERFMLVAHDRGARVAHRLALDHPQAVAKLVLLDIVPTLTMYEQTNKDFASLYFHWFFLIQPFPIPETLLAGKGDFFLKNWAFRGLVPSVISQEVYAEYLRYFEDPATLHATIEDYRAGASIDLEHDKADLDKKIQCPLLVLWGGKGVVGKLYDVISIWKKHAKTVQGKPLAGGHWLPEQLPDDVYQELIRFLP